MDDKQMIFILNNYNKLGPKKCSELLKINYNTIFWFAKKNNLKCSKEALFELGKKRSNEYWKNNIKSIDSYKINNRMFTENFTIESSYILGLIWADGHIRIKDYQNSIIIECVESDMVFFKKTLEKTGKWNYYIRKIRNNYKQIETAYTSNRLLCKFLKENDFCEKSLKSPNKIVSKIKDINLIKAFFLGVIDGDGCFYFNKKQSLRQFAITGSFKQDWSFFEDMFKLLNVNYKIIRIENKKRGYSQIRITNKIDIKKIGNFIYNEETSEICLPRKRQKYLDIVY